MAGVSHESCPTALVNAPVELVWSLLMAPGGWGNVFDIRVLTVDPPGRAVVGQLVHGETGPRILHLRLTFRMVEIDPQHHGLWLDVDLPFGIAVRENIRCTSLDGSHCRVDYRCNFDFPAGWRGAIMRGLLSRALYSGPEDSLSRLKRAAELRFLGQAARRLRGSPNDAGPRP
jgi:Polyketide cyclase / dehydrase and lipid transport